jgi:hypothetical protein
MSSQVSGRLVHELPADLRASLITNATALELWTAGHGVAVVFLPEITLLRYPADTPAGPDPAALAEDLTNGPTFELAASAATANGVFVHASLYEKSADAAGLGFNTAILVSSTGELVGRTRKLHIPISAGYYEDTHGHRIRTRLPRLRHPPAVAAGHRRQRHQQRTVHDRAQPHRQQRQGHLLRLVVHL